MWPSFTGELGIIENRDFIRTFNYTRCCTDIDIQKLQLLMFDPLIQVLLINAVNFALFTSVTQNFIKKCMQIRVINYTFSQEIENQVLQEKIVYKINFFPKVKKPS